MYVKLNEKYSNDFLTTQSGKIFYRKDNSMNKQENSHELSEDDFEINNLYNDGILVETGEIEIMTKVEEPVVKQMMPKVEVPEIPGIEKETIKMDKPQTIKSNSLTENVIIKEVVVESSEEVIETPEEEAI